MHALILKGCIFKMGCSADRPYWRVHWKLRIRRLFAGTEGQAVSLFGFAAQASRRAVSVFKRAMEQSVWCEVWCSAPHFHEDKSIPNPQESVSEHTFHFELDRERLRRTLRREGRYLLRSNMQATSPETVWESYLPPNESIGGYRAYKWLIFIYQPQMVVTLLWAAIPNRKRMFLSF